MTEEIKEQTQDMIARCLSGDVQAFEWIIMVYQDRVRAMLLSMAPTSAIAEEILQDTFVDAFTRLSQFDRERDFLKWLRGIARNNLYEEGRRVMKEARHRPLLAAEFRNRMEEDMDEAVDTRMEIMKRCLAELSEKNLHMIRMRYEGRNSFEAIAEAVGKSLDAVKMALTRIKRALKECVEGKRARDLDNATSA